MSVITQIRRKNLSPRVPSFIVSHGHWNLHKSDRSATYDFLLVIPVTMVILCHFRDKWQIWSKLAKNFHPRI